MPTPLSANSLEMRARYKPSRSGDKIPGADNMEVAMAATMFRDLQRAGYIPEDAELADAPPCKSDTVKGTSYEAILVELITDKDNDGRLDIDLDDVVSSGMLQDTGVCLTGAALIDTLQGERPPLTDAFLREQDSSSGLSYCDLLCIGDDVISDKGLEVQAFSENMVLSRNVESEIGNVSWRLEHSSGASIAEDTIAEAQLIRDRGDPSASRRLLSGTMDELIAANEFDAAELIAKEFQSAALKDEEINSVADHQEGRRTARGNVEHIKDGTKTYIRPSKFETTLGEVGDRRRHQIELARTMANSVGLGDGERFDAYNPEHVASYLQSRVDAGDSVQQVGAAYEDYLQTFYAHSGRSVTWTDEVALDDRQAHVKELLDPQPIELGGRKIIDCEAFCFITGAVMGDLIDANGDALFDVRYIGTTTHITSGVFAKDGSGGMSVNNSTVTALPADADGYSEDEMKTQMRADIDPDTRLRVKFGEALSSASHL